MDLFFFFAIGEVPMSLLKNIDELENVENLTHRAVLKAIRDTSFSMKEIAFHMKLGRTFIYYIVRRYLPQGYLYSSMK